MKEYKQVFITTDDKNRLDDQLNEYAKKGWCIKDTINNGMPSGVGFEFCYLLEREVKKWEAAFCSEGFEDRFIEYLASTKEEVIKLIENDTQINKDESLKYFQEIE